MYHTNLVSEPAVERRGVFAALGGKNEETVVFGGQKRGSNPVLFVAVDCFAGSE
jgi:hypothetical protein